MHFDLTKVAVVWSLHAHLVQDTFVVDGLRLTTTKRKEELMVKCLKSSQRGLLFEIRILTGLVQTVCVLLKFSLAGLLELAQKLKGTARECLALV